MNSDKLWKNRQTLSCFFFEDQTFDALVKHRQIFVENRNIGDPIKCPIVSAQAKRVEKMLTFYIWFGVFARLWRALSGEQSDSGKPLKFEIFFLNRLKIATKVLFHRFNIILYPGIELDEGNGFGQHDQAGEGAHVVGEISVGSQEYEIALCEQAFEDVADVVWQLIHRCLQGFAVAGWLPGDESIG